MLRAANLIFLLLAVILVVAIAQEPGEPNPIEVEVSPDEYVNDLEADASSWGHSRPWRYGGGWKGGWNGGWKGGWNGGWYGRGKGWHGGYYG